MASHNASESKHEYDAKYGGGCSCNDKEADSLVEQHGQSFQNSLDLNFPTIESTLIDLDLPSKSLVVEQGIHGEKNHLGEKRKSSLLEVEIRPTEENASLDLELKLAPPETNKPQIESTKQLGISSPSSQHSCTSLIEMDESSESDTTIKSAEAIPSLVVMGCRYCYIYVMVSEIDPQCPQCKGCAKLVDLNGNPAEGPRMF